MVKVGVIGLGTMGQTHAAAYTQLPNVELIALADLRPDTLNGVLAGLPLKRYHSAEELIADREIDMVDICLPTHLHKQYAMKVIAAKKHLFCEKPLARTEQEGLEMVDAAKAAGITFAVGHVLRFFPEYVTAKNVIDQGRLGKVGMVRTYRGGGGFPYGTENWYSSYANSGGLVLDMIIHDFDFLRWCFGEVERVYAKATTFRDYNRLEYALVTLRFQSGVIAHVEGSWLNQGAFATAYEIAGSNGLLSHDSRKIRPVAAVSKPYGGGQPGVAVPESPLQENPYFREIKHVVDSLEEGQKPMINAAEAFKTLRVALAALESVRTGESVTLS